MNGAAWLTKVKVDNTCKLKRFRRVLSVFPVLTTAILLMCGSTAFGWYPGYEAPVKSDVSTATLYGYSDPEGSPYQGGFDIDWGPGSNSPEISDTPNPGFIFGDDSDDDSGPSQGPTPNPHPFSGGQAPSSGDNSSTPHPVGTNPRDRDFPPASGDSSQIPDDCDDDCEEGTPPPPETPPPSAGDSTPPAPPGDPGSSQPSDYDPWDDYYWEQTGDSGEWKKKKDEDRHGSLCGWIQGSGSTQYWPCDGVSTPPGWQDPLDQQNNQGSQDDPFLPPGASPQGGSSPEELLQTVLDMMKQFGPDFADRVKDFIDDPLGNIDVFTDLVKGILGPTYELGEKIVEAAANGGAHAPASNPPPDPWEEHQQTIKAYESALQIAQESSNRYYNEMQRVDRQFRDNMISREQRDAQHAQYESLYQASRREVTTISRQLDQLRGGS